MAFFLFLIVNLILLSRVTEFDPDMRALHLYEIVIVSCLILSIPRLVEQLTPRNLETRPVTLCVLGVLLFVWVSHLISLRVEFAANVGIDFIKVVLYYLLLVGLVKSSTHLRVFILALILFTGLIAVLSLSQYFGYGQFSTVKEIKDTVENTTTGGEIVYNRLRGPGTLFGDPNDVCAAFVVGILLSLYVIGDKRLGEVRWLAIIVLGLCGVAAALTHSRGGFLGLVSGLAVLFWARFGWKKAFVLGALTMPVLVVLMAGRMTAMADAVSSGTGRSRIELWDYGLVLFRSHPIRGVGASRFAELAGLVTHNSYLECYAELGLIGGTFFLGAVLFALLTLWRLRQATIHQTQTGSPFESPIPDPEMRRLLPYLMAALVAYSVSMLSLSRGYVIYTYTILGMVTAFGLVAPAPWARPVLRLNVRWVMILGGLGMAFLVAMYVFVRVMKVVG